jgi:hypothetical protein
MELEDMETCLAQIENVVKTQKDPALSWREVLKITRQFKLPVQGRGASIPMPFSPVRNSELRV